MWIFYLKRTNWWVGYFEIEIVLIAWEEWVDWDQVSVQDKEQSYVQLFPPSHRQDFFSTMSDFLQRDAISQLTQRCLSASPHLLFDRGNFNPASEFESFSGWNWGRRIDALYDKYD